MIFKDWEKLNAKLNAFRAQNKKIVFTNGCFDILHAGHVDYLNKARECGDVLLVALNSDKSVSEIKGSKRPIIGEDERAFLVENLKSVDFVTFFDEATPLNAIKFFLPNILVKGADWDVDKIVGSDIVISKGGSVERIDFITNQSTSNIIKTIISKYAE